MCGGKIDCGQLTVEGETILSSVLRTGRDSLIILIIVVASPSPLP
jgi:hypothetical protein